MKERMESIWERIHEKQALESAARLLCAQPYRLWALKLSLSAVCSLLITLLPIAGAANL